MFDENLVSPCATTHIINQELEEIINKFGSFATIATNKPLSCVTLFSLIQKYPEMRRIIVDLSETSWYSIVEYMAYRYPALNKSKKIKK